MRACCTMAMWVRAPAELLCARALTARADTRLVFAIGATAMDLPEARQAQLTERLILMVRMIVADTQTMTALEKRAPEQLLR